MSTDLLPDLPPPKPSEDFEWRTCGERTHLLFYKGEPSGIEIYGSYTGSYSVSLGFSGIFDTASIYQAQAAAQQFARVLKHLLPVTRPGFEDWDDIPDRMHQDRLEHLLKTLRATTLSATEAEELEEEMLRRRLEAIEVDDRVGIFAVGLALAAVTPKTAQNS